MGQQFSQGGKFHMQCNLPKSEAADSVLASLAEVMRFPGKQQATPPGNTGLVGACPALRAGGNVWAGHAVALCFCKARQYTQKKPASGESWNPAGWLTVVLA